MNPAIHLVDHPASALTDAGWVVILVAALIATWWSAGRNLLYLSNRYQDGWKYLVPMAYAARLIAMLLVLAVDLWLVAAIVHTVE